MNRIDILKQDTKLAEWLCRVCDVEIYEEYQLPENEEGHLEYNIGGRSFAREGSGSEFILLDDGTIGYWGTEGEGGRLADNIQDFFELIINCPYWSNYVRKEYYKDLQTLSTFENKVREEFVESMQEDGIDVFKMQKYFAEKLNVQLYTNIARDVLLKFHTSATRSPRLITTYTENDGSKHSGSGSVFE